MFKFIIRNRITYLIFLTVATSAYMFVEVGVGERLISYERGVIVNVDNLPLSLPLIFTVLMTAAFATPLHNFIIHGETSYIPRYAGRMLIFASLELIPSLLFSLSLLAFADVLSFGPDLMLPLAYLLAAILTGIIFTTVLPHVATTPIGELNLVEAAKMSSGFRFDIAARLLRISVAIGIVYFVLNKLISPLSTLLPDGDTIIGFYAPLFLSSSGSSAAALVFVTLASLIYIRLKPPTDAPAGDRSEYQQIEDK